MAIAEMARRERTMPGIPHANASLTDLKAERVPQPARADRNDRTLGAAGRGSAATIVPQRSGTAIAEMARRERGTPAIRHANARLSGLRAGRALKPAKADRNDRTTRTAARAPTSSHPTQEAVTGTGRGATASARRLAAPRQSGGLARPEKDPRKAVAVRDGRRESPN
jgi:hypothetical protein